LQVLAFVLDATMASICATTRAQACVSDLQSICNELIALRPADATCLALMGKLLEAFGPVLTVSATLAAPIIEAFFGLLQTLHALRGGQPIGNDDLAPFVRQQRHLTKCYTALAAKAPDAFVPYLDSIAARTLELVAAQVLGDADKNMIFEGLLVSAAASGSDMFGRVVAALLRPLKQPWEALSQRIAGEARVLQRMLSPVRQEGTGLVIGGNGERAEAYYTLQLLVFCARQAKAVQGDRGGEVRTRPLHGGGPHGGHGASYQTGYHCCRPRCLRSAETSAPSNRHLIAP
jgi:Exportin-5 family